jgi:two-component system phosphate regulon response regulator PhoB
MSKTAVLIIGKGGHLRRSLETRLRRAGCDVLTASDGQQSVDRALDAQPDVVMLGYDMPDGDCLEVCRRIRSRLHSRQTPVFLLPPDSDGNELADDVLEDRDPVGGQWHSIERGMRALLTRMEATADGDDRISNQGLDMDWRRHRATIDGRPLDLTPTEFRLLWALASEPGKVFDRRLLAKVCACGGRLRGQARTIDVHIKAVRGKLGDRSTLVETVHGVGYRFRESQVTS